MTEPTPIIVFDHVVKEFKQRGGNAASDRGATVARAVDDVSLTINEGDIFGIIGYSGAGKSTLVRLINALEKPTSGTVTVLDTEVSALSEAKLRPIRQKIGMIFQQFNLFSTKTVAQNIAYPLQLDHWRKDYQDRRVSPQRACEQVSVATVRRPETACRHRQGPGHQSEDSACG